MPRGNQKGGKKHKRNKNQQKESKNLRLKEPGQEYAQIKNLKGNCRFDVFCFDGKDRMATLCGTMRKRKFVNQNDIVLVSLRDFQDDKCDIIDDYDDSQVDSLKSSKEIPDSIKLEEENEFSECLDGIEFTNDIPIDEESESEGSVDLDDI